MKLLVPLGTRPEIIKLTPIVGALRLAKFDVHVVATGQHFDSSLTDAFFGPLGLHPDSRWELPGDEAARSQMMFGAAISIVAERRPDAVLILGDTNTVPVFCLAARRARVPIIHLEAGLRSFNPTSVEEVNRQVAGALASLHLAPTELAARFLRIEGVDAERIRVVGNPIIDVLRQSGIRALPHRQRAGVVVTAHRATNVDDPARLACLGELLVRLADHLAPVTFPVHPRTRQRLEASGMEPTLRRSGITLLEPVPWRAMLDLMAACRVVVTDSGGLQEEASYLGLPVVVLRRSTPRWEGVAGSTSVLTGLDPDRALDSARQLSTDEAQERIASVPCPYGDGRTSERVVQLLQDPASAGLLRLEEPDFVGKEPPR